MSTERAETGGQTLLPCSWIRPKKVSPKLDIQRDLMTITTFCCNY